MIDRIRRYLKLQEYKSTTQYRKIFYYFRRMRRDGLKSLSEEEYHNLDELIEKERLYYEELNRQYPRS